VDLELVSLAVWGLLTVSLVLAVGAIDLVRRQVSFRLGAYALAGWTMLALLLAAALLALEARGAASPWAWLAGTAIVSGVAMVGCQLVACGLVLVLALSRSLRPEGSWRWRKGRLLLGLLALLALTPSMLSTPWWQAGLALLWACSAALVAFARDGGPRLERGGAAAISLLGLGLVAMGVGLSLHELGWLCHTGLQPPSAVPAQVGPALLAVGAVCAAIWRRPDPAALGAGLPLVLIAVLVSCGFLGLEQPAITRAPVEMRTLSGEEPSYVLQGENLWPPSCVRHLDGRVVGQCEQGLRIGYSPPAWQLPPGLPLSQAPDGPWVVHRPRRGLGSRLGYHALVPADPSQSWSEHVRLGERDGSVVLLQGPRAGAPATGFWAGQEAVPLQQLSGELERLEAIQNTLLLELPRSEVWTVQDAVSICASFTRASWWVQCRLSGP
jgi:hypothetical protein